MQDKNEGNGKIWNALSRRWNIRILRSLDTKTPTRFNELKQLIHGISGNVLSARLDELEKIGLVKRIVIDETSFHIGYILDQRCEDLKKILLELDEWIPQFYKDHHIKNNDTDDSVMSKQLLELLKNEITETEFNFIKDKLSYSFGITTSNLITNFQKLKDVILELFGDETGNKLLTKLNSQIKINN